MSTAGPLLLLATVAAVGVLHTIVPDHWAPICALARQHGWTRGQVVRSAALAGVGHTVSTLCIAALVWVAGAAVATRFGVAVDKISGVALVAFGLWIAIASWRELHSHSGHGHSHEHFGHSHVHRHGNGTEHRHWHEHHEEDWHATDGALALTSLHEHEHATSARTALLVIVGSSPMIEGIPAFFAASRYGIWQLVAMSIVFALSTIITYVAVCITATGALSRIDLGPVERYGEVMSGAFVALVGLAFLIMS